MPADGLTLEGGGTVVALDAAPRAFLVVHVAAARDPAEQGSRVVDLPDGLDVTFGRSREATVSVDHEKVSRLHARVRRTGSAIEVEDLGSRNGTRINGERIEGVRRVVAGDEISLGPIQAVVSVTSGLRRERTIADVEVGERALTAEVDRALRYRRSVTVALVRIPHDEALEAIGRAVRPMDLLAEHVGDDYLVLLPELERAAGAAALGQLIEIARSYGLEPQVASVTCPADGTQLDVVIGRLRAQLRGARASVPETVEPEIGALVVDPTMQRVYGSPAGSRTPR